MYFYAQLNDEGICTCISQLAGEIDASEKLIPLEGMDESLLGKRYEDGAWHEVPHSEPDPEPEPPIDPYFPPGPTLQEQIGMLTALALGLEVDMQPETLAAMTAAAPIVELHEADDWRTGVRVQPGVKVVYKGEIYQCRDGKGHVTQSDWPPDQAHSLWEMVIAPSETPQPWEQRQPGVKPGYVKGEQVTHKGRLWETGYDGQNYWEPGYPGTNWIDLGPAE